LAPLRDVTQIGLFLFLVASPKVAKASTVMTVACYCHRQFRLANFANVNDPYKRASSRFIRSVPISLIAAAITYYVLACVNTT
jgi:hypothetical protein